MPYNAEDNLRKSDKENRHGQDFRSALLGNTTTEGIGKISDIGFNTRFIPAPQKGIKKNENGIPLISFSNSEMDYYTQDFNFTLIGKFSYWYQALHIIKKEFHKLNLTGEYFVGILNVRHILIKLSNELDYLKIWGKGMI